MVFDESGWHKHQCVRTKTVERNGEWYCWQHDPERTARKEQERREASEARWKRITNQTQRTAAERAACEGVPTDVLEKVRVADLLEENAALRALLREWFIAGAEPLEDLVERTRADLNIPTNLG